MEAAGRPEEAAALATAAAPRVLAAFAHAAGTARRGTLRALEAPAFFLASYGAEKEESPLAPESCGKNKRPRPTRRPP